MAEIDYKLVQVTNPEYPDLFLYQLTYKSWYTVFVAKDDEMANRMVEFLLKDVRDEREI